MTRSKIRTTGAEGLTLSSTQLTVANGLSLTDGNLIFASGHGLDFTATGEGTGANEAEKLDDYEEGTWTPSIDGRDFSGNKYGVYVKIGRVVYVHFECNTMTGGDDSDPYMTGLPFTSTNATSHSDYAGYLMIHEPYQISGNSTRTYAYFRVGTNTTQAQMLSGGGDGGEYSHVGGITMGNGDHMRGNGFYFTDA